MTVISKAFKLYDGRSTDTVLHDTMREYIKNTEQMFIDAGLVKSNVIDNLNWDDDNTLVISTVTPDTEYQYLKPMYFDMMDEDPEVLPIRIGVEFGLHIFRGNNTYMRMPISRVTIGLVGSDNEFAGYAHTFPATYTRSHSSSTYNNSILYGTLLLDSVIVKTRNVLGVTISPGDGYYITNSSQPNDQVFINFLLERVDATTINLFVVSNTSDYTSSNSMVPYIINSEIRTYKGTYTSHMIYGTKERLYNQGNLVTYPVMLRDAQGYIKQSTSLLMTHANSLPPGNLVTITINGVNKQFIKMPTNMRNIGPNTNITLIGIE